MWYVNRSIFNLKFIHTKKWQTITHLPYESSKLPSFLLARGYGFESHASITFHFYSSLTGLQARDPNSSP